MRYLRVNRTMALVATTSAAVLCCSFTTPAYAFQPINSRSRPQLLSDSSARRPSKYSQQRSRVIARAFLDNLSRKRKKISFRTGNNDESSGAADEITSKNNNNSGTDKGDAEANAIPSEGPPLPSTITTGSKLRVLKDIMWVRETLEDLTAAEFACTVEAADNGNDADDTPSRRRKRAVDYENLLRQLNVRLQEMGCEDDESGFASCKLDDGTGAGRLTYSTEQRQSLLERLIVTRQLLLEVIKGYELEFDDSDSKFQISLPELPRVEIPREEDPSSPGPKLYVRDDGTVDWDGALQDQAAIKNFGTAVWARINGRDPENVGLAESSAADAHSNKPMVTVKIEETDAIVEARERLKSLSSELDSLESDYIALINSVISPGQAVANVNLAMLEPAERTKVRATTESIELMKERVNFQTLVYELERVFTYLSGELGNPSTNGYIPLPDRLNVAEFGLLESQIDAFHNQIRQEIPIDPDVMAVVLEQMTDFKRRLGIDYLVTGITFDGEAMKRYTSELVEKSRKGLAFYAKGCKLFWNDIVFCLSLVNRAAQGYTLKPREVRTIRRTFKDFITFIPFVIILLIPLSPIGHVMVFGAIQRFFPDFFPSCFTEQRQNLLQLYETAEYREFSIDENWREKLARLTEAMMYSLATSSRATWDQLRTTTTTTTTTPAITNGEQTSAKKKDLKKKQ